ncbi:MAG: GNAT family N-acetyltransferase, partial [Erysipelotrichaceae bacterium]|nr:GNAT family N-acetyltransferase [Erysipelotrichaceae bacterium]
MIRKATIDDVSRIAEILVFVKRIKFLPIFKDEDYSFNTLQVLKVARDYSRSELLDKIFVYDDGIVKGFVHVEGKEIKELYVDHFFQSQGIGSDLIEFAKKEFNVEYLWAIEKNSEAIRFYQRHGFHLSDTRKNEEGTVEFLVRMER